METKQKDLIETVRINDEPKSSQIKPREVDIKVSLEDYNHVYRELNVATNTTELADKIKLWDGYSDEYFYNEIMIYSFPRLTIHLIDDSILSYVSCCITYDELETRMKQEDGEEQIVIEAFIHTQQNSHSSVYIR